MKCPFMGLLKRVEIDKIEPMFGDCLQEECAWWQKELQNCIIYQLGMEIGTLCYLIEEIKEKMPHAVQFVK